MVKTKKENIKKEDFIEGEIVNKDKDKDEL